ncbi:MAG: hypothetical protein M3367_03010 [Acidobacteriota bacterium]|nr:hypothetical protein [Acidobacteriota bacterium]
MAIIRDKGVSVAALSSAARTASGDALAASSDYGSADTMRCQLNVTAVSGTAPTLDVVIEDTLDGTNFNTIGTFAQKTATGREVINITIPFTERVRIRWTIAGTTPSFTFGVDVYVQ